MKKDIPIIINGTKSKISYNKSKSDEWSIEQSNNDTVKIIDELLKNADSGFIFERGITVSNPVTTIYLVSLDISRPSNHIGIIRHELPSNTIITYNIKGMKKPRYGLIKSGRNIRLIKELKKEILQRLESKEQTKNIQKRNATKSIDR